MEVSESEVQRLYQEDYFRGDEYGDYLADAAAHRRNSSRRWRRVVEISGGLESLFEIGCAYGFWLECASRHQVRCAGVDVCVEAIEHAAKRLRQEATAGDFLELALQPGEFQAFCMWDTIEHLTHPEKFIDRVVDLLPPGGWFFCTTGDIGSRLAQRQGSRWRMIHPPTHLQYYSADTMRQFLTRHGLDVVALESTPMYRSLRGTIGGLKALSRGWTRRAAVIADHFLPHAIQERVGFWLDLGDIMFVAARKPVRR
jgi:cyclopropane fatty-acyl-phospholipid synthase-like methyltransferase